MFFFTKATNFFSPVLTADRRDCCTSCGVCSPGEMFSKIPSGCESGSNWFVMLLFMWLIIFWTYFSSLFIAAGCVCSCISECFAACIFLFRILDVLFPRIWHVTDHHTRAGCFHARPMIPLSSCFCPDSLRMTLNLPGACQTETFPLLNPLEHSLEAAKYLGGIVGSIRNSYT